MPLIQLKTGKTIYVSSYEYYFMLDDNDVEAFFEQCVADDLGTFQDDPFSSKVVLGKLEIDEELPDIEDPSSLDNLDF